MVDRRLNYGRDIVMDFSKVDTKVTTILDLGAGKGIDLTNCGKLHPGAKLIAVESFPPYIQILKENNMQVLSVDIERESIPISDESVDIIISNQVFEHLKDIFWTSHEISRILKKNGTLILGVPNLASLHNRLLLLFGMQPTSIQNNSAHLRGYTKGDVLKFFESGFPGGFVLEDFKGANFYPFPPQIAVPLAKLLPSMSWAIFFQLRKTKSYENASFLNYVKENKLETNFWLGNQ